MKPSPFGLTIGRGNFDPKRGFLGEIDEVAIYDRVLTDDEIAALHDRGESKESISPNASDAESEIVWPLSTMEPLAKSVSDIAVASTKSGEGVVVANALGDLVIAKFDRRGLGKPAKIARPSKELEGKLAAQRVAVAHESGANVHVFAWYLGLLERKPHFVLHAVTNNRGRLVRRWSSLNETLGIEHAYDLPRVAKARGGALSLLALGRLTDGQDVIATADASRKGIEKRSTTNIELVAADRIGNRGRSIPLATDTDKRPLLLTDHERDLLWVDSRDQLKSYCLSGVRKPLGSSYKYALHVTAKGNARVAVQVPAGEATIGESSIDVAHLVVGAGSPGKELRETATIKSLFPRLANIAFAESRDGEVFLVSTVVDLDETAFDDSLRLDVWRVGDKDVEWLGSVGRVREEIQRVSVAALDENRLLVAAGSIEGA